MTPWSTCSGARMLANFKVNESLHLAIEAASCNAELARLHRRCGAASCARSIAFIKPDRWAQSIAEQRSSNARSRPRRCPPRNQLSEHALRTWEEVQNNVYRSETPAVRKVRPCRNHSPGSNPF